MAVDDNSFVGYLSCMVLAAETNDGRFEEFCRGAVSTLEGGATVFSTSASWDLGRDGVGGGRASGLYVCCSLRDDADIKSLSDIERLTSTTSRIDRVYFCSSHTLSEYRRQAIENAIQAEFGNAFEIVCLGATQLVEAVAGTSLLEKHYGAEIKNIIRAIAADPDDQTEIKGLRLALISSAADNSSAIRSSIYKAALLDVFSDGIPRALGRTSTDLSAYLRLARNIADAAVAPHLDQLAVDGLLTINGGAYTITEAGRARIIENEREAALRALDGRQAIRSALEEGTGCRLSEDHFNRMWSIFEERLAHYFHSRGDAIVQEISVLVGDAHADEGTIERPTPMWFVEDLATAVAATSSSEQQRSEIFLAIKDLFTDRASIATDWLVRISASFMAACAIGLEHSSNEALAKLLGRTSLVLDTDVVLSLVGQGEPEHESVVTIVTRWIQLGGKVLLAEPVLEEVAYHAHISQMDFDAVRSRLPGTPEERIHCIENVFVRSFAELLSQGKATFRHWNRYIEQYRGRNARDWAASYSTIAGDYGVGKLPPRGTKEAELEDQVRRFLSADAETKLSGEDLRIARDKARRDAQLYAALVHHVENLKAADPGAACLLVSSARRLAHAEATFRRSGESELIVSVSTVLYLLSMHPGVSLGLGAMKAFLFDDRHRRFSSDLERTLVRLVTSSTEFSMPWAKRGTLMRSVREQIITEARKQGEHRLDVREADARALAPRNAQRTAEMLRAALDAIAVDGRTEKENVQLRAKVKELEDRASRVAQKRK